MQKGIIGKKMGMTQIFDENGKVVPVTVVEAGPCPVVQKKTPESDGYTAVQLGYGDVSAKKVTKPEKGHFEQGQGLRGRYQALGPAPPAREPRLRPGGAPRGFHGFVQHAFPCVQGQEAARPSRRGARHRTEPESGEGGRGK